MVFRWSVRIENTSFTQSRPLKVLYVGKLSQQKGIANLFTAVERLKNKVELTIVGRRVNNLDCEALDTELNNTNGYKVYLILKFFKL